jgi:hypothetical protein
MELHNCIKNIYLVVRFDFSTGVTSYHAFDTKKMAEQYVKEHTGEYVSMGIMPILYAVA